jgi:uncharacterized protein YbjQ (UPF0145 family)
MARTIAGGEVRQVTQTISEGRHQSFARILNEAQQRGAQGVADVTSDLRHFQGNIEFLSVASAIHTDQPDAAGGVFSAYANGQELYCIYDCGYQPLRFVMGNVAYSMGLGGGLVGGLKRMVRGEVSEYSDVFNKTRHKALARISDEARAAGANAVLGIETVIKPFQGVHEMLMLGTAAWHPALTAFSESPVTSDLTCEEMWNLASLGYAPLRLVLGTAVYSLGIFGGLKALFKSMARGEISDLTSLVHDAREHAVGLLRDEAASLGADSVVGIKTYIHEIGGLVEFMAIGTAVSRLPDIGTLSDQLPPQAVIRDQETWFSTSDLLGSEVSNR